MPIQRADRPTVFVVDQDASLRSHICSVAAEAGCCAQTYSTAAQFLADYRPDPLGCLVIEWELQDISGLLLQEQLSDRLIELPRLFLTERATTRNAVQAIRGGAYDLLQKPVGDDRLRAALLGAIERHRSVRQKQCIVEDSRKAFDRLTPREQQVFWLVVVGRPNKTTARQLKISEASVETYRSRLMKKLDARNLADLIQLSMLFDES